MKINADSRYELTISHSIVFYSTILFKIVSQIIKEPLYDVLLPT